MEIESAVEVLSEMWTEKLQFTIKIYKKIIRIRKPVISVTIHVHKSASVFFLSAKM